jgi:probable HAF family extracellular repeat protein
MKKVFILLLVIVFSALLMQGCSGGSSSLDVGGGDGGGDDSPTEPVIGDLGDLIDLGDLVYPQGDHWYFTWARAINDEGTVIGQSNKGDIASRAAFKWEPGSETMTFLGIHPGFTYSQAVDINATGTIIGYSSNPIGLRWPDECETRAFFWENGDFIDLPPATGHTYSEAVDINNKGEMVLTMDRYPCADVPSQAAYYWDGETFVDSVPDYLPLCRPVGAIECLQPEAVAINENGQAIINTDGTVLFHDPNWDIVEALNHLSESLNCAIITVAVDINDSGYINNDGIPDGHVIGNSGCFTPEVLKTILSDTFLELPEILPRGPTLDRDKDFQKVQGFFWDGGAMYPVDHLGGGKSVAADINNKDQVVGAALTADRKTHAFLWTLGPDEKGVIRDLGTLGGDNSFALAINEAGQVVGWAETGEFYEEQGVVRPVRHAFLWEDGQMYDLGVHNDFYDYPFIPPYPFSYAVDINEQGILNALTGNSVTINEHSRGFFLSPEMP